MSVENAVQYLEKSEDLIEQVQHLLISEKNRLRSNDDKTMLGDCVISQLKGLSDSERIEYLCQITSFLHLMIKSAGLEWEQTECFGAKQIASSRDSDRNVDLPAMEKLFSPGLRLLLCSLYQESNREGVDMNRKASIIKRSIEYCERIINGALERRDILELQQSCGFVVDDLVGGFSHISSAFEDIHQRYYLSWKECLSRRRQELDLLVMKIEASDIC
eukprot:CAMPEP_0201526406 /NCGR_PEP_ID=MMETSP0161_2-20130828/31763_1 /ASSEMBLY_ACC=CAM_ASM_000251 /TAXON_ID=180227 /ORGANISM="Neoparamoeba aestuarina, Strain SoJaBio B1-5/56/2" /LENGTH=217 /DNA_ID=CAMNT_0047926787 /DNA_START=60 /DNA_END=710 /DNA_ORIENTATION=+